jgi:hypothetical protein
MIYQKDLGGFLVFPVFGVWFNLQNLRFFPTYFMAFFLRVSPRNPEVLVTVAMSGPFLKINIYSVGL